MNASTESKCQRCGAVIPPKSTEALCPACLLSGALEASNDEAETISMEPKERLSLNGPTEIPCEFGGYRLLGLLGRGGMGTVYEAEQLATGRRVALKMLGQQLDSSEMRQRFLREGRLAARVSHPNSLYIFGSEEVKGHPVITMEIAGCGTLKDTLKKHGPLPVAEAVDAVIDIISGLESACAVGVLHRDIKPSNCFVWPDGSVKVGDFGLSVSILSKSDSFVTAHGKILGTPAYASPEQLRGDTLDVRADIYSVGATLYTLLTKRAPFEGSNAVQVVANAVNQKPKPLTDLRKDVPPGLEKVVARCLAKEPDGRFSDYQTLRNALLPFSSREPEPVSLTARASAGWIDYLIALLVPYVTLMLTVGALKFHMEPFVDRSLYSARYYIAFLAFACLYFTITEGIFGCGPGKLLKGMRVVGANGRRPGIGRALVRILVPICSIEIVRIPFLMATIQVSSVYELTGVHHLLYIGGTNVFAWIPVLLTLGARRENGFATVWDRISGTRVQYKQKVAVRPPVQRAAPDDEVSNERAEVLGPYQTVHEIIPGEWILATDPLLRLQVWLLRRHLTEPSLARRNLARQGQLRWLQEVHARESTWDAFEAVQGVPFTSFVQNGRRVSWGTLRHWLHDLASEIWQAAGDGTLPAELSLDHVWITAQGHAVLLERPWPDVEKPAEVIPIRDLAGEQRFLSAVGQSVESSALPLHARPILQNLGKGKFEKLSFLTGTLRGLLERPTEIGRWVRAGSIFMMPVYVWILAFVGTFQEQTAEKWTNDVGLLLLITGVLVLGIRALVQLVELPFRTTCSHAIFRLAVTDKAGRRAGLGTLLWRWAIVWIPMFLLITPGVLWFQNGGHDAAFAYGTAGLAVWIAAAVYANLHPHRGLHDRLAGTWVVRI